jgi:hypothetical protein
MADGSGEMMLLLENKKLTANEATKARMTNSQ